MAKAKDYQNQTEGTNRITEVARDLKDLNEQQTAVSKELWRQNSHIAETLVHVLGEERGWPYVLRYDTYEGKTGIAAIRKRLNEINTLAIETDKEDIIRAFSDAGFPKRNHSSSGKDVVTFTIDFRNDDGKYEHLFQALEAISGTCLPRERKDAAKNLGR